MTRESWTRLGGVALVGAGIAVALVVTGREARATDEPRATPPSGVTARRVEVERRRAPHVFMGVVRPTDRAMVAFVEGGRLVGRAVDVGDRVEAGQVLAQLDPRPYANAVRAATAQGREVAASRAQVARDHARAERLAQEGVTTESRLEQSQSGLDRVEAMEAAAAAQRDESRRRQREATLRAPFAGVVTDVFVEAGELVGAGRPVLRLAGAGGREVRLEVPVELAAHLAPGAPVALRAVGVEADDPLSSMAIEGRVRAVAGDAASAGGLYPVLVDVPASVRAGLGVEATLEGPEREALHVPLSSVLDPSGRRPFVWTVVDGHAVRAWLHLGRLSGADVEVTDGLAAGDLVVVRGHTGLLEGDAVALTEAP
ncbi:MAG: efflux RND transporter periplasmic adaptor subunit [Myxococcales bacterium]|nr:efflux RND transporter periplasmic adaptor subunit [Myxococcales bacterium]